MFQVNVFSYISLQFYVLIFRLNNFFLNIEISRIGPILFIFIKFYLFFVIFSIESRQSMRKNGRLKTRGIVLYSTLSL